MGALPSSVHSDPCRKGTCLALEVPKRNPCIIPKYMRLSENEGTLFWGPYKKAPIFGNPHILWAHGASRAVGHGACKALKDCNPQHNSTTLEAVKPLNSQIALVSCPF